MERDETLKRAASDLREAGRNEGRHLPVLDGVRGLAIFLLLMHQLVLPNEPTSVLARMVLYAFDIGWIGVQLFFVLSGFLITTVLLETREMPSYFRAFYGRRILRIFPLYYLLLITLTILPIFAAVPQCLRVDTHPTGLYWVYLSNWVTGGPDVLGHTWSLAVEEQFYLLWPFVVRTLSRPRLFRFCLFLAVASLLLRIGLRASGTEPEMVYHNTLTRMDALALGAAVAIVVRDESLLRWFVPRLRSLWVIALVAFVAVGYRGWPRIGLRIQTAGYSALVLLFALIILTAVVDSQWGGPRKARITRILASRPLRVLGKYSYGMYILQLPLQILASQVLVRDLVAFRGDLRYVIVQPIYFVVMFVVIFGLAVGIYHLYEVRFLALKRYFHVGSSRKLATPV